MQGGKHYYLILYSNEIRLNKKNFSDVLIKQADTEGKEFKTIMSPVNCFDTLYFDTFADTLYIKRLNH